MVLEHDSDSGGESVYPFRCWKKEETRRKERDLPLLLGEHNMVMLFRTSSPEPFLDFFSSSLIYVQLGHSSCCSIIHGFSLNLWKFSHFKPVISFTSFICSSYQTLCSAVSIIVHRDERYNPTKAFAGALPECDPTPARGYVCIDYPALCDLHLHIVARLTESWDRKSWNDRKRVWTLYCSSDLLSTSS